MENEEKKSADIGLVGRYLAFLSNPRTLVAFAISFLVLALSTKDPMFMLFDLIMTMILAYRATGAIIAEVKAK